LHPSTFDRQNEYGFKLEHTASDRWVIEGLDKKVEDKGYSTYSILNVTFGPTQEAICNFQVIMNNQNAVGSESRVVRQQIIYVKII
jgi:hypothetical protein